MEYAKSIGETQVDNEKGSYEAEVLQLIVNYIAEIGGEFIYTKAIADEFNLERTDRGKWKVRTVGTIIKRLGFNSTRAGKGKNGYKYDQVRAKKLMERYQVTPPTPETSSPNAPIITHGKCDNCGCDILDNEYYKTVENKKTHLTCDVSKKLK